MPFSKVQLQQRSVQQQIKQNNVIKNIVPGVMEKLENLQEAYSKMPQGVLTPAVNNIMSWNSYFHVQGKPQKIKNI